ncbi:2Fe-2S iron-sulfur cluster-binding protein [Streptomyces sp. NBC_01408]|uniref:2Fe-2S iron-sulfur cluster-binding protein n=1 Tax=Streptomyces sp. NBC_01408 TaxID=2903855 RepID=UPI002250381C|nr:2Fe-2S iron-sulfur cluster-binding protein [Streptomyces sp. NBC_01408]MCX4693086.1 2Fe-2S iron-sulfur cluster-binding protein [Streptomyces sp. NBC_01408]
MSENENGYVSGATGGPGDTGPAGSDWGWQPVPHGGEYDSDATAFVKLPQDMLDALDTGEPLAAPGHGYVPPPMIVPLGSATTDPSATGTWTIPVQWPEAGAAAQPAPAQAPGPGPAPVGGPIPASIPIPASVAAAFANPAFADPDPAAADPGAAEGEHDPGATAEWRFPEVAHDPGTESVVTGQWSLPDLPGQSDDYRPDAYAAGPDTYAAEQNAYAAEQNSYAADWSQAPATLPGGAAAPWANHPGFDDTRGYAQQQPGGDPDSGTLPGTDEAAAASAAAAADARLLGGPGAGARTRGPRVLGGPGVGTPLPEGEPVHPAPHDIEAAHGPAAAPVAGERPHPGTEAAEAGGPAEPSAPAAPAAPAEGLDLFGGARAVVAPPAGPARPGDTDGHGFAAFGHAPEPGPGQAAEAGAGPEHGPGHAAEAGAGHAAEAGHGPEHGPGHAPEPGPGQGPEHGPGHVPEPGLGRAVEAEHGPVDSHGFSGAAPVPAEAEHGPAGSHGLAEGAPVPEDTTAAPTPAEGAADLAVAPPGAGTAEGFPPEEPAYEEEGAAGAVAHHEHPLASYVLRVNGADRPVTGAWIGESLLYVLRERLGLAGAKDGCSQGECGACAVQVDGRLVASCLVPAATSAGSEVRTVEGLATDGELSDVQQALCRSGAVQCGFCVPGMAMTIHDLLEGNHAPSELETRQALCGNLCRCSGYAGVVDAVREVVAEREATASGAAADGPAAPQISPEPRIPHQAAPGEGGIHHGGTA